MLISCAVTDRRLCFRIHVYMQKADFLTTQLKFDLLFTAHNQEAGLMVLHNGKSIDVYFLAIGLSFCSS